MSQFLYRLGRSAAVHPYRTIGAWVLLAAVVFAWQGAAGGDPINDYRVPGVESQHASDTLAEQFPDAVTKAAMVYTDLPAASDRGRSSNITPVTTNVVSSASGTLATFKINSSISSSVGPAN